MILCFTTFQDYWLCLVNWECNNNHFVQSHDMSVSTAVWFELRWYPTITADSLSYCFSSNITLYRGSKHVYSKTPKSFRCVCSYMFVECVWSDSMFYVGPKDQNQEVKLTTVILLWLRAGQQSSLFNRTDICCLKCFHNETCLLPGDFPSDHLSGTLLRCGSR